MYRVSLRLNDLIIKPVSRGLFSHLLQRCSHHYVFSVLVTACGDLIPTIAGGRSRSDRGGCTCAHIAERAADTVFVFRHR